MIVGKDCNAITHAASIVREEFLSKLTDRLVIIPAAGLGTRVGSPPAKELLKHPLYSMTFLEKALERVSASGASVLVVSRQDKLVLNEWLKEHEIPHILVTPTFEWVQTVMMTQKYWQKKNVLLLPDTEFSPEFILSDLFEALDVRSLAAAVFQVEDLRAWGGLKQEGEDFFVAEKIPSPISGLAWGLIGFTGEIGDAFWTSYLEAQKSKQWSRLPEKVSFLPLTRFQDLTRG